MRVLFFAGPNLSASDDEIAAIANTTLDVRIVRNARITDVLNADYKDVDVMWFAAHGGTVNNAPGIELVDGWLEAWTISAIVKSFTVPFVYLNSCSSADVALQIINDSSARIVCTLSEINDDTAMAAATLFARRLAEHGDFERAFVETKPVANNNYRILGTGHSTMSQPDTSRQLADILRALTGDPFTGTPGLIAQVSLISQRVDSLIADSKASTLTQMAAQRSIEQRLADVEQRIQLDTHRLPMRERVISTATFILIAIIATAAFITFASRLGA